MKTYSDTICLRCGCTCNDIRVQVQANQVVATQNACELGEAWFRQERPAVEEACRIDGALSSLEQGITQAAGLLKQGRWPLIYGLHRSTTQGQRAALALAEKIGAVLDSPTSLRRGPMATTFRGVGEVTATLGEIRNRSDLVLFWGCNPMVTHPRHAELYSLLPAGEFLPNGRKDRYCVVVAEQANETAAVADAFVPLNTKQEFAALWVLRAIVNEIPLDAEQVQRSTGSPLSVWSDLAERMKNAKYGALLFEDAAGTGNPIRIEALQALIKDLNRTNRFVGRSLGGAGNRSGADQVFTWTTGFPSAISFSRRFPRFNPGEYSAQETLEREEADVALIVGTDCVEELSEKARQRLRAIPTIFIDTQPMDGNLRGNVEFVVSLPGVDATGTTYRVDGVSFALRPLLSSPLLTDWELLMRISVALSPD